MKKIILTVVLLLMGIFGGYFVFSIQNPNFEDLSYGEMYKKLIEERDYAINRAVEKGAYKCCIHPPCTMCYMEANQWNNQTAGTCACDNLIAQGKEPCPQCKRGLCENKDSACSVKSTDIQ